MRSWVARPARRSHSNRKGCPRRGRRLHAQKQRFEARDDRCLPGWLAPGSVLPKEHTHTCFCWSDQTCLKHTWTSSFSCAIFFLRLLACCLSTSFDNSKTAAKYSACEIRKSAKNLFHNVHEINLGRQEFCGWLLWEFSVSLLLSLYYFW